MSPTHGNGQNLPQSQAQEIGKSSSNLCEDAAVYAKTNNHNFLIRDDCNLRLHLYRDLPQRRATSSCAVENELAEVLGRVYRM